MEGGARDNGRLVLGGLLVLGAACAAASARQNFIASGALAGFWGPLLLTGAGLALAFRHVAREASSGPVEVEPSAGTPRRFGLLALAYVFIVWALAGQMLPWAYTTVAGTPYARTVYGELRAGDLVCPVRFLPKMEKDTFRGKICVPGVAARVPASRAGLRLHGRRSALGVTVERAEAVD